MVQNLGINKLIRDIRGTSRKI